MLNLLANFWRYCQFFKVKYDSFFVGVSMIQEVGLMTLTKGFNWQCELEKMITSPAMDVLALTPWVVQQQIGTQIF
jgi:hypothetical protein